MAEVVTTIEEPILEPALPRAHIPPRRARAPLSWGAILGGAVSALGVWLLLDIFGLALGLSRIDPNALRNMRPWGIFAGVWAGVTPLVALFVGGWVAARGAGFVRRSTGALHGLVVWGVTTLVGAAFVALLLSALIGGVAAIGQAAIRAGGEAVGALGQSGRPPTAYLGLDADQALAPVNARLIAEGKPPVTPAALQSATTDVLQSALASGHLDRDALVGAVSTSDSALTRADAQEIADRIDAQYTQRTAALQARAEAAANAARTGALKAASTSGRALWGVFGSLLLGLIAAMAGGATGALDSLGRRLRPERVPARTRVVAPQREVYP